MVLIAGAGALVATLARRAAGAKIAPDERVPLGTWLCAAIWLVSRLSPDRDAGAVHDRLLAAAERG